MEREAVRVAQPVDREAQATTLGVDLPLSLDEQAYARIKAMIAGGTLLPGERIVPEQFARDMGISRTPMLSALKRLYQEGLVEWRSRRGIYIRRPSKREFAQIFEIREAMEGIVARRAATRLDPQRIERFASLFADIEPDETPWNRRRYLQRDYELHAGLLLAADSPPLTSGVEALNIMISAFSGGLIRTIREGMAEHEAILDALRRRDPEAAETAMRLHIRRSVDRLYQEAEAEEDARTGTIVAKRTIPHEPTDAKATNARSRRPSLKASA